MSGNYIKTTLKEAREAIKNKDYHTTLNLCKGILKEDKDNYMALVFLGVSLQEIGPSEQAPNAFRKAIKVNQTNVLAWNGLLNYYEKLNSDEFKNELVDIYLSLLQLENTEKKYIEYSEKVVSYAQEFADKERVTKVLQTVLKNESFSGKTRTTIRSLFATYLSNVRNLSESLYSDFAEILKSLIENPNTVSSKYYADYLKILYKQGEYESLFENADKMFATYDNNVVCMEWMCKVYNELEIENNALAGKFAEKVRSICDILLRLESESTMGLFTKSIFLFKENHLVEVKDNLIKVSTIRPGLLHAWVLLSTCFLKLHLFDEALDAARKAEKLLSSINNSNQSLRNILDKLLPEILSKTSEAANWTEAIEICLEKMNDCNKFSLLVPLCRSYINLENFNEADKWISELKDIESLQCDCVILVAKLLEKRVGLKQALDYLDENKLVENSDIYLEIGHLYCELGEIDKCLVPFLKAAKLDPNSYICFLNLGNYYQKVNDLNKARRCYEKSFKISMSITPAVELSNIYRKQKNWDANLALLENLTSKKLNSDSLWTWIQVGLSYMEKGDYDKAVDSLRYVTRMNPTNSSCWESLADAYMARGAYTSSLKSYQRAAELNPNSLYPHLQIACVKQLLGQYPEARDDFETIVSTNNQYIPALKGLSETSLSQARQYRRNQLWGLARDCAQHAIDNLTLALKQNSRLSCLWKLAGDSCFLVANLPERYCCLLMLESLFEGKDVAGKKTLQQNNLYTFAARCYCKSISLIEDNILIWHDLAKCYLSHAQSIKDSEVSRDLYDRALAAIHQCVNVNPNYWPHWNLMGNVAFSKEPKNYSLAQHAFIQAVTIEKNSAITWCNLGGLYLHLGDIKLANEAFSQAQRSDPNYVVSWVGQALIAERLDHEDAMDLFRHSTQLGHQPQGAIGYGYWVCRTLLEATPHATIYSIHNMHAVPIACDALTWYTENNQDDNCAWNMLGLLRERMGLKASACEAFKHSLRSCDQSNRDLVSINYGRSLVKLGKNSQAIEMYNNVREATFNSGSGLALALFKDEQYEESYGAYEAALHWLTEESSFQSDLLVALASMAYLFQGPEAAKTLLFQSTQLESSSPWGLYATLSLGLLHDDLNLAHLVLKELEKLKDDVKCLPHYAALVSYVYLLQGQSNKAVYELSKLVHRHPEQASLWLSLSMLLLRLHEKRPITFAAERCAQIAMKLGRSSMDVTKVLCLVSLGLFMIGNYEQALKSAQQAIHCFPNVPECWAVLISALSIKRRKENIMQVKLQQKIDHVKNRMDPTPPLRAWLDRQSRNLKGL